MSPEMEATFLQEARDIFGHRNVHLEKSNGKVTRVVMRMRKQGQTTSGNASPGNVGGATGTN